MKYETLAASAVVGLSLLAAASWTNLRADSAQIPGSVAYVDLKATLDGYKAAPAREQEFDNYLSARSQALQSQITQLQDMRYLDEQQRADMQRLLKIDKPSADDLKQIDDLRKTNTQRDSDFRALQQKQNKTSNERDSLELLSNRSNTTDAQIEQFQNDAKDEVAAKQDQLNKDVTSVVQGAIDAVAKTQGYGLVFDKTALLHGGTDITQAVVDKLNSAPAAATATAPAAPAVTPPAPPAKGAGAQ